MSERPKPRELQFEKPGVFEFIDQVTQKLQPGEMARGRQVVAQEVRVGVSPNYPRMRSVESTTNTFEVRRINERVIVVGLQVNDNPSQIGRLFEGSFVMSSGNILSGRSVRKPIGIDSVVTPLVEHRAFSNEDLSEAEITAFETIRDGVLGGQMKLAVVPISDSPRFMDFGFSTFYMSEDPNSQRIENSRRFGDILTEEEFRGRVTDTTTIDRVNSKR